MIQNHQQVRDQFPILNQQVHGKPLVYLDNAATTHKPQVVLDEIDLWYNKYNSNIHRGIHYLSQQATEKYENARKTVQTFIGAKHAHEIIFTRGATESVNTVAHSFGEAFLKPGDEVIITEIEHHANLVPWQMVCKRYGAKLKYIPLLQNGSLDIDALPQLLTSKTKILAINHVSNSLGTINPIKQVIALAHQNNIPVLVDAAQSIQHMPVNVEELDCDFLVFSGHKIYGPTGTGVLYGKEQWLEQLPPYQYGGDMVDEVTMHETTFNELPFKFEAGTTNYIGASGLARAINFVEDLGINNIHGYEQELYGYMHQQVSEIEDIIMYSNAPEKTGALSFNLPNAHASDVGMIMDKLGIALRTGTHCTQPVMHFFGITATVRASIALYNNKNDIDGFIQALQKAAFMLQ